MPKPPLWPSGATKGGDDSGDGRDDSCTSKKKNSLLLLLLVCEKLCECSGRRSEAIVKGDDKRMRLTVAVASPVGACAAGNRSVICFRLSVEAHQQLARKASGRGASAATSKAARSRAETC